MNLFIENRLKFSVMITGCTVLFAALLLSALANQALAEVTRFEILERTPVADGQPFGDTGPYERIVGRVHYTLDMDDTANQSVVDLAFAKHDEHRHVNFAADLFILAPIDLSHSCGTLLYDVNNRGNKLALRFFNDGTGGNDPQSMGDFGHGFLMRHGFIVVWSGWDGELLPGDHRLQLEAPTVDPFVEAPFRGTIRCEFVPSSQITRSVVNWENHGSYRPIPSEVEQATLTVRERPSDPRRPIPRSEWNLIVTDVSENPSQLPRVEVEIPAGMLPGHIYELIYEAKDSLVMGCGFTAVRDLVSALKNGEGEGNPLLIDGHAAAQRGIGFGVSQSGRFLRELLYHGFNRDLQNRKVFDGLMPHVAGGGLGSFNHRFAQPTRHANQHDHHDYPPDRFPFTYGPQIDPYTGEYDGILLRTPPEFQPLIIHTQSSAEYWTRSGSLVHTDPKGQQDAEIPDNVRIFAFGGTQHGPADFPPGRGNGKNLANPGDYRPQLRALALALDQWSRGGPPCPESICPTIRDGTLVDWHQGSTGFPEIPDAGYPLIIQQPPVLDFGPRWRSERIVDRQPPGILATYRTLAPRVDADGNDLGCLSPPEVAVPVATYTGWNLRSAAVGAEDQLVSLGGSYIPFCRTRAEREARHDPRISVEERYTTLDNYLQRLSDVCHDMEARGVLLPEDSERIIARQKERVTELFSH